MSNTVDKVIAVAKAEIGYLEKSKKAYQSNPAVLDDKTAGAGYDNYTKYGRDMHAIYPAVMDFPAYWCDCFVDWCFMKAYGVSNAKMLLGGNFDDYTVNSAGLYKKKNAYYKDPQVGDQVFFNNGTRICHTGLVIAVTDITITTNEGNTTVNAGVVSNGGGVTQKTYKKSYSRIDGYGRPAYDKVGSSIKADTTVAATQTASNAPTFKVGKEYTTLVDLNVRTGAGTNYSKKKYNQLTIDGRKHAINSNGIGILKSGTVVTCKAVQKENGNVWIMIPSGWIAAYYSGKVYIK